MPTPPKAQKTSTLLECWRAYAAACDSVIIILCSLPLSHKPEDQAHVKGALVDLEEARVQRKTALANLKKAQLCRTTSQEPS